MNARSASVVRNLFATIALFGWALWLGGLIALFVSVQTLFARDRSMAAMVAPVLFTTFERYQLILAGVALTGTAAWRMFSPQGLLRIAFVLLALSTLGAIASPLAITSKMENLRRQNLSSTPEFRRLHGQSMMVYTGQTLALAAAGVILPVALARRGRGNVEA